MGQSVCQISLLYIIRNPKVLKLPWLLHARGSFTTAHLLFSFIYFGIKRQFKFSSPRVRVFGERKAIASQSCILDVLLTPMLASKMDQQMSFSPAPYGAS